MSMSSFRDQALDNLAENLPLLAADRSLYIQPRPESEFDDLETYPNFEGSHLVGSKDQTARIGIAVAVIKKPIYVFRDFLQHEDTGRRTNAEYYLGLMSLSNGSPALAYARVHRNVILNANAYNLLSADRILGKIKGIPILETVPEPTIV